MSRILLGIDPGTLNLGYGLVEVDGNRCKALSWGTLSAKKTAAVPERLPG